ncbi:MAG TPA: beta-N-acetylhexosaminidase [Tahibacter sp.]|nr:beta-N-acetylhexosaminidase [Tahibacter sp.]
MLIIGISGKELTAEEREHVLAPEVSGVILFSRNYASREQVTALIDDIRTLRPDPFLLCVDQEGGPVQRFREGMTRLPALGKLGAIYDEDPQRAIALAEEHAWVMASEMRAVDIDISFAPVIDLARGNRAIGTRALHVDPAVVSTLGLAYLRGMRLGGMAATLKHFPGHGSVLEDTHFDNAADPRTLDELRETDLVPFADAIAAGAEAVMLAHVAYPAVDAAPAGYSRVWIEDVLRGEFGFRGVVFSDDIGMAAAESAGGVAARIDAHLSAGCDLVLACSPALAADSIAAVRGRPSCSADKLVALRGMVASTWESLVDNPQRSRFIARLAALDS